MRVHEGLWLLAFAVPALSRPATFGKDEGQLSRRFDMNNIELEPLLPVPSTAGLTKRQDALDLQSSLTLKWANSALFSCFSFLFASSSPIHLDLQ